MLRSLVACLLVLLLAITGCKSGGGDVDALQAQLADRDAEIEALTARLSAFEAGPTALSKHRNAIRDTPNPGVQVQPVCVTYLLGGDEIEDCRDSLVADVAPPSATEMVQFRDAVFLCYEEVEIGMPLPACWSDR